MKLFTIKLVQDAPKSSKTFQVACGDNEAWKLGMVLEASQAVHAFHVPDLEFKNCKKYTVNADCSTKEEVSQSIMNAINRINEARIEKYAGCYVESFVGGPGDYSPPDCGCEKCINAGRSYRYQSFEIPLSKAMFEYFYAILGKDSKSRKWGLEYTAPGAALICLYDHQKNMSIRSNKSEIRIGVYVWNHEKNEWRAAQ